jgi:hypothetical protein
MTRESRRLHASRVFLGLANSSNASDTGRPVLFGDFPVLSRPVQSTQSEVAVRLGDD